MIVVAFIFLSSLASAFCLASGMARHQRDLFGRTLSPRISAAARGAGWGLMGIAAAIGIAAKGWAVGIVASLALVQLGALAGVLFINRILAPSRAR